MSQEINASISLRVQNGGSSASQSITFTADQAGTKYQGGVQIVGTTEESLDKGDVGTIGFVYVRNADPTNYVELGAATTQYACKVKPGMAALIPWDGSSVFIKANTAPVNVEYLIVEA